MSRHVITRKQAVTAVVAAYNEESTIAGVLDILTQCSSVKQIIVVDDGSTDRTASIARTYGVRVVSLGKNRGKSAAILASVPYIRHDVIFLCDADLLNLTTAICEDIIRPVETAQAAMSIGMRDYGYIVNAIAQWFPSISGDRALTKAVLVTCGTSRYFYGYGMELVFHYYCREKRLRIVKKVCPHHHTPIVKKRGLISGFCLAVQQAWLLLRITIDMHVFGWR